MLSVVRIDMVSVMNIEVVSVMNIEMVSVMNIEVVSVVCTDMFSVMNIAMDSVVCTDMVSVMNTDLLSGVRIIARFVSRAVSMRHVFHLFQSIGMGIVLFGPSTALSACLLYTSPSPRDRLVSRMPSSA